MAWRDTQRALQKRVHEVFRVRAVYMLRPDAVGRTIHVRLRQKEVELQAADGEFATISAIDLRLLFDRAEVSKPMPHALVLIEQTEAYRVISAEMPYLDIVTATVVRLPETEAAALWAIGRPVGF